MSAKTRNASSAMVCVEPLESRRLMSAVPLVAGDVFTGTSMSTRLGHGSSTLTLTITAESKSGQLTGTLVVVDGSGGSNTFAFKGSVNKHDAFTLNAKGPNDQGAKLVGAFSSDTMTVAGRYVAHRPHHPADGGTFTASRG